MAALSPREAKAVADLTAVLYRFLPGTPHPYDRVGASFPSVANRIGVGHLWPGGSKTPAIQHLLSQTLTHRRDKFCALILALVTEGLTKRANDPITKEEIELINTHVAIIGFKVPQLWDSAFLSSLPRQKSKKEDPTTDKRSASTLKTVDRARVSTLKANYLRVSAIPPQQRGFEFEKFLHELFEIYGFVPRPSFKLKGEQIDGSFTLDNEFYLFEAKWRADATTQQELIVLNDRVRSHSAIGRGMFITAGSFSPDGVFAFQKGRSSSIIGIDGQDLYFILENALPLDEVIRRKLRWLVETGEFHYCVQTFLTEFEARV